MTIGGVLLLGAAAWAVRFWWTNRREIAKLLEGKKIHHNDRIVITKLPRTEEREFHDQPLSAADVEALDDMFS